MPLEGRNREPLGVLLVGSSLKELVLLKRRIVLIGAGVVAAALFIGPLISLWISTRVIRHIEAGRSAIGPLGFGKLTRTPVPRQN
jgi:hypothetical protein